MAIKIVKPKYLRENFLNIETIPDIVRGGEKTVLDWLSDEFLNFKDQLDGQSLVPFTVTSDVNNRVDLISFNLYGTVEFWWLISRVNGIFDPMQDLTVGRRLLVPRRDIIENFTNQNRQEKRRGNVGTLNA